MPRTPVHVLAAASALVLGTTPARAWISTFHRSAASAVAVDAAGNVVAQVAPGLLELGGASGAILWTNEDVSVGAGQLPPPGGPPIAVDAAGDVFAAGTSSGPLGQDPKVHVTKLHGGTGTVAWTAEPAPGAGTLAAVDGAGDVIVGAGDGLTVIKLAGATGAPLWEYTVPEGFAEALAIDPAGDVYVAGSVPNPPNDHDLAIVKLDGATGAELWRYLRDGGAAKGDRAFAIALDADGDVAAAGSSTAGFAQFDFTVVKVSGADGSEQWHYTNGGANPAYREAEAGSVAFDASGDVVAAGQLPRLDGTLGFSVVKLAGDTGGERWSRSLVGTAPDELNVNQAYVVAVDSRNDVIAAGFFRNLPDGAAANEDFGIVKLDGTSGAQVSRFEIDGAAHMEDRAFGMVLDANDDVVAAGQLLDFYFDAVVAKLSERIPAKKMLVSDGGDPSRRQLVVAASGGGLLIAPSRASVGDPTITGAALQLLNPTTGEQQTIALPASGWSRSGGPAPKTLGYVYGDKLGTAGPCRRVVLKPRTVKASCSGSGLSFSLDEPAQGALGVVLTTGDHAGRYCMLFGAPLEDRAGRFLSKSAPQPSACPAVP